MASSSRPTSAHPSTPDSCPSSDRTEWLDARIRFRNAASEIMFVELLYPEGTQPARDVQERLTRFHTEHADAAYELLRHTQPISGTEGPSETAQRLPKDLHIKAGDPADISLLTFAIERNEGMLRAIRQAVDVLLYYIGQERATLQVAHRGQLFKD